MLPLLGLAGPAQAGSRIVDAVRFSGHARVGERRLRATITTRPGQRLDRDRVRRDIRALWRLPQIAGVRVSQELVGSDRVRVLFELREHPTLRDLVIRGANPLGERHIRRHLELAPGATVDPSKLRQRVRRIEQELIEMGYFRASVREHIHRRAANTARVAVLVSAGPRPLVRRLRVRGNRAVRATQLLALIDDGGGTANTRGGIYRPDLLAADLQRMRLLYHIYGFDDARVGPMKARLSAGQAIVDVEILVVEGPRRSRPARTHQRGSPPQPGRSHPAAR